MMQECHTSKQLREAFITLDAKAMKAILGHTQHCPSCKEDFDRLCVAEAALATDAADLPPILSPTQQAMIWQDVIGSVGDKRPAKHYWNWIPGGVVAGAAMSLILFLSLNTLPSAGIHKEFAARGTPSITDNAPPFGVRLLCLRPEGTGYQVREASSSDWRFQNSCTTEEILGYVVKNETHRAYYLRWFILDQSSTPNIPAHPFFTQIEKVVPNDLSQTYDNTLPLKILGQGKYKLVAVFSPQDDLTENQLAEFTL